MALQDYIPKRRNHADDIAAIEDQNDKRPRIVAISREPPLPGFLARQDQGLPRASSLPAAIDDAQHGVDALRTALQQEAPVTDAHVPAVYEEPEPEPEPELTDLEHIALWFKALAYDGYNQFAVGVVGDEMADEFMKKLNAWQKGVNAARVAKLTAPKSEAAP